ncbi:hypothetical protein [Saccharothrix deserti]|uniref:hypothetical protein n=1 Tax=Saccharothrix deserti TaxID=2593674 RepID=UPI00131D2DB5|nr:hypothetical protein [Saccharothrix deserti]
MLVVLARLVSKVLTARATVRWERERARSIAAVVRCAGPSLVVDRRSDSVLIVRSGGAW